MLIREALDEARQRGLARLDAQLLLVHVLTTVMPVPGSAHDITRSWLLAHDDHWLSLAQRSAWSAALLRRAADEPLAYIVGEQVFCGLLLQVTPAVLIPRPETEGLVEWAVACLQACPRPHPRVLDLGTGSGAVALAIKHRCPDARVWATDISPAALAVAAANAQRLRLPVTFANANWWAPTNTCTVGAQANNNLLCANADPFDLVVSNPPYITAGDRHLAALQHEPRTALVGSGADGLADLQQIISGSAGNWLSPGAWLLLEHGHHQASALHSALLQAGFEDPQTRNDLAGLPRCTGARWPWPAPGGLDRHK